MKRTTSLNLLASDDRANAWSTDASNSHSQKGKRKQSETVVVHDDRLLPYSQARSISWAQERHRVLGLVQKAIKPKDILEVHACELKADLIMQIRMLDRFRALVLERARGEAITSLLVGRIENAHGRVVAMLKGDESARAALQNALATFGIPEEAIEAEAFMMSIDEMERLSRLSAQAQIRLDLQLKQIERRRPMISNEIKALTHADIVYPAQDEDHAGFTRDLSEPDDDRDNHQEEFDRLARDEDKADDGRRDREVDDDEANWRACKKDEEEIG